MKEDKLLKDEKLNKVTGGLWTIKGLLCDKYVVRDPNGEELKDIAEKCNCAQSVLANLNNLKTANRFPIGSEFYYPVK